MEAVLGSIDHVVGAIPPARKDTTAADLQDQDEANDRARDRYQRLFWEPVADNEVSSALCIIQQGLTL